MFQWVFLVTNVVIPRGGTNHVRVKCRQEDTPNCIRSARSYRADAASDVVRKSKEVLVTCSKDLKL